MAIRLNEIKPCPDEWHISWEQLVKKYGDQAEQHYNPARTCPSCGEKIIPGD